MLTVHHLGVSQSERIVWLCEELSVPYELRRYDRDPVTRLAPPEFKALHPFGVAPVITDGALVLAESGAIIEYIIVRYGKGRLTVRPDAPNYADYLFWFHFANGSMMPVQFAGAIKPGPDDSPRTRFMRERCERSWQMVEARLGAAPYFAGAEFTAADIIMLFPLTTMRAFAARDLAPFPNVRAYLQRIGARPAYRQAMQKGDPQMTPLLA
ncbi:MAG TPA: glutathione S-transferase family protein [Steroidobacteraceae bacterium]|nr:glutathione S-transferase family protein [Steroidobacteraceae bacterium]